MKKLIAIAVLFALAAGVSFAETTVGGQVFVAGAFLQGDNVEKSYITTGALDRDIYNTAVKITFSEGNAGGRIRFMHEGANGFRIDEWFGWWRPIPQLKIQLGSNQDGDFGTANISGWGFTGENKNNGGNQGAMAEYMVDAEKDWSGGRDHSRTTGWYGGTGGTANLQLSAFPIDGLSINLWFPWPNQIASLTFIKFHLQAQYRIPDIGTASLTFQSNTGYLKPEADAWYGPDGVTDPANSPKIFASFYLTAIDDMDIDLGLAYKLPFDNTETKTVTNHPFEIGLGYRFVSGDFGIKLRTSVSFGASIVVDGKETDVSKNTGLTQVSASILPSYKIGTLTVFLYTGLGIQAVKDYKKLTTPTWAKANESNVVVNWFVNPYVVMPVGSLRFKAGFQLHSDGINSATSQNAPTIKWAVPFGFYAYF